MDAVGRIEPGLHVNILSGYATLDPYLEYRLEGCDETSLSESRVSKISLPDEIGIAEDEFDRVRPILCNPKSGQKHKTVSYCRYTPACMSLHSDGLR